MSLIREALEKARREGPQIPAPPTTGPWRAHRRADRPSWPRTLAVALASVAASAALTVFLIQRGDETLVPAPEPAVQLAVVPPVAAPVPAPAELAPARPSSPPDQAVRLRAGLRNSPSAQTVLAPSSSEPPAPVATTAPRSETPPLRLEGIVASPTNPVAVVNGRLLGLGESIDGYRVTRIDSDQVELEKDGVKQILRLR